MIVVHSTRIIKTHDRANYHAIAHYPGMPVIGVYDDPENDYEPLEVTQEMVEGERFVNKRGEQVVIGWDEATQTALGLPFKVFESMRSEIDEYILQRSRLRKQLREWEEMTAYQLIKRRIKQWWTSFCPKT